jgi:hypothetical protein
LETLFLFLYPLGEEGGGSLFLRDKLHSAIVMSDKSPTSDLASSSEPMEAKWKGTTAENCAKMVEYAKLRNPMVKFMIDKLEEVGWIRLISSEFGSN